MAECGYLVPLFENGVDGAIRVSDWEGFDEDNETKEGRLKAFDLGVDVWSVLTLSVVMLEMVLSEKESGAKKTPILFKGSVLGRPCVDEESFEVMMYV